MPKALIALLSHGWMGASRLPRALCRAGWQVDSLCAPHNLLAQSRFAGRVTAVTSSETVLSGLVQAVNACQPDVLIPGCETAVRWFHQIARASTQQPWPEFASVTLARVRQALGNERYYDTTLSKTRMHALAQELGLRVPSQVGACTVQDALLAARQLGYPLVLKGEHGFAGQQVCICHNESDLVNSHRQMSGASPALHIDAQQYIRGTTAMCAGVAKEGRLLESVFALKLHTHPLPTSPCSVAGFANDDSARHILASLVQCLGFNGFCSCDVMVESETNDVYLLEFNPRPVPLTALGHLDGHDLCAAYAQTIGNAPAVAGAEQTPKSTPERQAVVAFFPNEWLRDANSPYLLNAYHDVPWDDPPLLRATINAVVKPLR